MSPPASDATSGRSGAYSGDPVPLGRLLYTSRYATQVPAHRQAAMAREIATISASNNRRRGLSGCLLQVGDGFVQVLEGPMPVLETVFEAISCDLRHQEICLIDIRPVEQRMFSGWAMALLSDDGTTMQPGGDLEAVRLLAGINPDDALRRMAELLAAEAPCSTLA